MVESKTIGSEFVELAISSPRNFGERSFLSLKPRSQWNDGGATSFIDYSWNRIISIIKLRFSTFLQSCCLFEISFHKMDYYFVKNWINSKWNPFVIYEIIYKINNEIPNFNTL